MKTGSGRASLTLLPDEHTQVLHGLASPIRLRILQCIYKARRLNVNEVSAKLGLPQSTVATNIQMLERAGLIVTETLKARKGQQKICRVAYDEIVFRLDGPTPERVKDAIEVSMPIGLYTSCDVTAPCGLCSKDQVIGLLDVPDCLLDPGRMQAALVWFWRGYVEYKFPNNARVLNAGNCSPWVTAGLLASVATPR